MRPPAAGPTPLRRPRVDSRGLSRGPDGLDGGAMGTLPPAPPDQEVRLSIFEELQSEWFSRRGERRGDDQTATSADPAPWDSPADDGWRAAARLATPTIAGTTPAGLPKRVPQALYVPGAVGGEPPKQNGVPNRSPQEVRGRLASYRDGVRRGRHAERPPGEE